MEVQELTKALADAGCGEKQIKDICRLQESGKLGEMIRLLRCCRCDQLGTVHEEQRKIDIYDYLIGNVKKEMEA